MCVPGCKLDNVANDAVTGVPTWCMAWSDGVTDCARAGDKTTCHAVATTSGYDNAALKAALGTPYVREFQFGLDTTLRESADDIKRREEMMQSWGRVFDLLNSSPIWNCEQLQSATGLKISCNIPSIPRPSTQAGKSYHCYQIAIANLVPSVDLKASAQSNVSCVPGCIFPRQAPWLRQVLEKNHSLSALTAPAWCSNWTDGCNGCGGDSDLGSDGLGARIGNFFGLPQGNFCTQLYCFEKDNQQALMCTRLKF
jgi:hypothetical protein